MVVVGSANVDLVVHVEHRPGPGETVLGRDQHRFAGGKGANQAVAAARAGARVALVARLGADPFGDDLLAGFLEAGIEVAHVRRVAGTPTGTAFITVTPDGENGIVVAPGANAALDAAAVEAAAPVVGSAAVVCAQLEVPLDGVRRGLEIARASGALTVLTPAPATPGARGLARLADVLVPNLGEARALVGDPGATPRDAARRLRKLGARAVLLTLGGEGALLDAGGAETALAPCAAGRVVDTTGAGDTLVGVLAATLARGAPLAEAAALAVVAAGISVTRRGAQAAMPTLAEIRAAAGSGRREGG